MATALLACQCAATTGPAIVLSSPSNSPAVVMVTGLEAKSLDAFSRLETDRRQEVLRAWVAYAPADAPPVLGQVTRRENSLVFTPRYPFKSGVKYRVQFNPSALLQAEAPVASEFLIPALPLAPAVRVAAIYPTSDELPENLLKFYIHFSGPMSQGEAYERVHLLDDKGQVVAKPFLELEEELWNPQMTRFTLFFDPGRIKHGLVSQMQLGSALAAGRTYELVVDAAWHDSSGRAMVESSTKTFHVVPAERHQPDPSQWRIATPKSGSVAPLVVSFGKPLDHALLQRAMSVRDDHGTPAPGRISIGDHEREWSFTPQFPWRAGHHSLSVETILEDVAGNSIGRLFEVDESQKSAAEGAAAVSVPFDIH